MAFRFWGPEFRICVCCAQALRKYTEIAKLFDKVPYECKLYYELFLYTNTVILDPIPLP